MDVKQQLKNVTDKSVKKFSFKNIFTICKCVNAYDGDTCRIVFPFNNQLVKITLRLYGYDSPEIRSSNPEEKQKALEAKEYLQKLILNKIIYAELMKFDKYGRTLAKLYLDENKTQCINDMMLKHHHGKEYYGGTKISHHLDYII